MAVFLLGFIVSPICLEVCTQSVGPTQVTDWALISFCPIEL
jgi:hypothetical protein